MNEEHENTTDASDEATEGGIATLPEPASGHDTAPVAPGTDAETVPPVAVEPLPPAVPENKKKWYVVKVQSGREDSIKNNLERRIKIEALEEFIGRILIPVERVTEVIKGKRVEKKKKKFPGYLMCEVEFNDRVLFLFRETSGVGDFVGGSLTKLPHPMNDREVDRMLRESGDLDAPKAAGSKQEKAEEKISVAFAVGDRVKVLQGMFKDSEGEVKEIPPNLAENSKVKVVVQFWGRPVDVDVDYWQVEPI